MQHGTLLHSTLAIVMTLPVASVSTWNPVLALNGASCTNLQRVIFFKKSLLGNISRCVDEKLQTATFAPICCSCFMLFMLGLSISRGAFQLYSGLLHSSQSATQPCLHDMRAVSYSYSSQS